MKLVDLAKTIGRLKQTKRSGWVFLKVPSRPESIADHIMRVSVLALVAGNNFKVDRDKLVRMALVHDLGESLIGDIVTERAGQDTGTRKEKERKERKAIKELFKDLEDGDEFIELWEEFEKQETEEARILRQLDKFEAALQVVEYKNRVEAGVLDEIWETVRAHIKHPVIKGWFEELKKERKK